VQPFDTKSCPSHLFAEKKSFWKQLEIVIRVLKNGSESSEVTCSDSYCGQSFHMSRRYFSQRIPSGDSFVIFSYSGYYFVFSLLQQSIPWAHTVQLSDKLIVQSCVLYPFQSSYYELWVAKTELNSPLDYSVLREKSMCRYPRGTLLLTAIGWVMWASSPPRPWVQPLCLVQPGPNPAPTEDYSLLTSLSFGSGFSCRVQQQYCSLTWPPMMLPGWF